jgi:cytochrome c oxidase subunit IV
VRPNPSHPTIIENKLGDTSNKNIEIINKFINIVYRFFVVSDFIYLVEYSEISKQINLTVIRNIVLISSIIKTKFSFVLFIRSIFISLGVFCVTIKIKPKIIIFISLFQVFIIGFMDSLCNFF